MVGFDFEKRSELGGVADGGSEFIFRTEGQVCGSSNSHLSSEFSWLSATCFVFINLHNNSSYHDELPNNFFERIYSSTLNLDGLDGARKQNVFFPSFFS